MNSYFIALAVSSLLTISMQTMCMNPVNPSSSSSVSSSSNEQLQDPQIARLKADVEKIKPALLQLGLNAYRKEEYSQAFKYFEAGRNLDDADAYNMLAKMYKRGQGVNKNKSKAEKYKKMYESLKGISEND